MCKTKWDRQTPLPWLMPPYQFPQDALRSKDDGHGTITTHLSQDPYQPGYILRLCYMCSQIKIVKEVFIFVPKLFTIFICFSKALSGARYDMTDFDLNNLYVPQCEKHLQRQLECQCGNVMNIISNVHYGCNMIQVLCRNE